MRWENETRDEMVDERERRGDETEGETKMRTRKR